MSPEHDSNIVGWILAGIFFIINLISGLFLFPIKNKVNETEKKLNDCQIRAGERLGKIEGKIYHYEKDSKRHEEDIGVINSKLDDLSTKITTVETLGITHQSTLARMEKKMDKVLGQDCGD